MNIETLEEPWKSNYNKFLIPNLAGDSPDKAVTYGECNKLDLEK